MCESMVEMQYVARSD